MQRIFRLVSKVAPTESTVLILGESGTGKELIARALHLQSKRANGAFVPVNCASLPENLIESELFGYVRGAFTGAAAGRRGLIEEADGGCTSLTGPHEEETAPITADPAASAARIYEGGGGWSSILSDLKTLLESGEKPSQ